MVLHSGNGRISTSELYLEVALSLTSSRDDLRRPMLCSDVVFRKEKYREKVAMSVALLCKHNVSLLEWPGFPLTQ